MEQDERQDCGIDRRQDTRALLREPVGDGVVVAGDPGVVTDA